MIHAAIDQETTRIFRKHDVDVIDDLADEGERAADDYNRGLDMAARIVAQNGDRKLAALIRRQKVGPR